VGTQIPVSCDDCGLGRSSSVVPARQKQECNGNISWTSVTAHRKCTAPQLDEQATG
jgi:hypothetical protein